MYSDIHQIRMGLDELRRAVSEQPEKVLDAMVDMCDHCDDLAMQFLRVPLGTPEGTLTGTRLQAEVIGLQKVLGTLFDKLTTKEPDDNDGPIARE